MYVTVADMRRTVRADAVRIQLWVSGAGELADSACAWLEAERYHAQQSPSVDELTRVLDASEGIVHRATRPENISCIATATAARSSRCSTSGSPSCSTTPRRRCGR
jgi:hypothetical protein